MAVTEDMVRRASGMGISGEQIRRELAESRARSQLGGRGASAMPLPASLSMVVAGIDIDWFIPLLACYLRGFGKAGLALGAVTLALRFFSSRFVRIERDGSRVLATTLKAWRIVGSRTQLVIDDAELRYWGGWFCSGFELRGSNVSIVASCRRSSIRPPRGVRANSVARPPLRLNARAIALTVPNILLMGASGASIWMSGKHTGLTFAAFLFGASSLACCLVGGPRLVVSPTEPQPSAA